MSPSLKSCESYLCKNGYSDFCLNTNWSQVTIASYNGQTANKSFLKPYIDLSMAQQAGLTEFIFPNIWCPFWYMDNIMDKGLYPLQSVRWNYISTPDFSGSTTWVWVWKGNFISHFSVRVITYPCWELSWSMSVKGGPDLDLLHKWNHDKQGQGLKISNDTNIHMVKLIQGKYFHFSPGHSTAPKFHSGSIETIVLMCNEALFKLKIPDQIPIQDLLGFFHEAPLSYWHMVLLLWEGRDTT